MQFGLTHCQPLARCSLLGAQANYHRSLLRWLLHFHLLVLLLLLLLICLSKLSLLGKVLRWACVALHDTFLIENSTTAYPTLLLIECTVHLSN